MTTSYNEAFGIVSFETDPQTDINADAKCSALVGQQTRRIAFGTGVTCPIYRYHPATVAQAFASLATLAPGRVFLGLGTSERLNEQAATDQFGPYVERHDRLIEAIELIRQLWSGQRISFQGPRRRGCRRD